MDQTPYLEVFNEYYSKMTKSLQTNKEFILTELSSSSLLLPDYLRTVIRGQPTDHEKAKHYLNIAIKHPLEIYGQSKPFKDLLSVMENFPDEDSKTLAQEIKQKLRTEQPLDNTENRKQDILRSMLKARKDNCCIRVRYGKVLFCGAGAAGKTNFLNLLMKKDFEQKHKSTELVKPQQVTIAMKALVSSINRDVIEFTKMDIDEEIQQLMSYLPKQYTEQATVPHHVDPQHTVEEDVPQNSYTTAEDIISEKLASDHSGLTKKVAKHEWDILTFMDTGGQPQFISMLPTVNSFAMITFIVHKMAKGEKSLDDKVMVQHGNQQGKNSFTPHPYECTYIQLIKTLMTYASSVLLPDVKFLREVGYKNTTNTNSNISIIGTHSAEVSADDIEKVDKALTKMIKNAGCKNVKPNLNEEYKFLVPVDNKDQTKRNKSDSDTVMDTKKYTDPTKICKHIHDFQMEQDVYSVPIQWLLLELEIRKVCNDKKCCFITYKDVLNLATEKKLGGEDFIKNGLRFHHLFGVLLYFEDVEGICELVITNHQWLFDKLTEIVHYSFKCNTMGDLDELDKGIFKDAMLKKLKIEEDFENANIDTQLINPKKSFLNLLKYLKIIAPLKIDDETRYFMPSLLKSHPLTGEELEKSIPGKNSFKHQSNENTEAEPFLFQLESPSVNLIPRGFFCFLVVELIGSTRWQLFQENLHENLVTFFKVEGGYFVTLIDKIFFLEVCITHVKGNVHPIHYEVLKTIHNTMVEVEKTLNIRCIIKHGFLCKKCPDTEQHLTYLHMTHVDEDGIKYVSPSDSMGCDCIHQKLTSITSSHQIWLQKNKNLQGNTPQGITLNGSFEYSTVEQHLTEKYVEYSHLPYESMKSLLYSKKVITTDEKQDIESKKGRAKMEILLDIIISSLKAKNSRKYKGFIEAMEESEDIDLKEVANRLCSMHK